MSSHLEPKLAPPGAGLPAVELFFARLIMGFRHRSGNREIFRTRFLREREGIARLIESCPDGGASRQVLINRCVGLEDSSRNWSVWMTLDHLRIVNAEVARVIASLAEGIVPPGEASTAAVKPSTTVGASVVGEYEASCDSLLTTVAGIPDLETSARYAHPWFGPLDASAWFSMAGGHMGIHRQQMQRILRQLKADTLTQPIALPTKSQ